MRQAGIFEVLLLTAMIAAPAEVYTKAALWTVREHANVRAGPSTKADIVTVITPGTLVRVDGEEKGWSVVAYAVEQSSGGKAGYVRTHLLVMPKAAEGSSTRADLSDGTTKKPKWSAAIIVVVVVVGLAVLVVAFALIALPILLIFNFLSFIFRPCPKCKRLWSRVSEGRDYTDSRLAPGLAVRHTYANNYACKRCGHRWFVIGSFVER